MCDFAGLIARLVELATGSSGLPLLRTYWYDGAENAVPTMDQLTIARLPNVKLRLGRLVSGGQKGVDALIYRDLMTLARERAISEAFLIAGDEDLREGVVVAQDMGVRVVLVGITPVWTKFNQSDALVRESDARIVLDGAFLTPYFRSAAVPGSALVEAAVERAIEPVAEHAVELVVEAGPSDTEAEAAGRAFTDKWAERATADEIRGLAAQYPRIPYQLDRELLAEAQSTLGDLWDRQDRKYALRRAFWARIKQAVIQA